MRPRRTLIKKSSASACALSMILELPECSTCAEIGDSVTDMPFIREYSFSVIFGTGKSVAD